MDYWTTVVWLVIAALVPVIIIVFAKQVQDFILTRSAAQQATIRSWMETFVEMAQIKEPDPEKRKAFVVGRIMAKFPMLPVDDVSALIERVVVDLKLWYENIDWADIPPALAE